MVLNQLSAFWFEKTRNILPNHVVEVIENPQSLKRYLSQENRFSYPNYLSGRSMVVRRAKRIPVECVVRGYLAGSAWADYQKEGSVSGVVLPKGLRQSQELSEPIFTPTTKEETGHDQPIDMEEMKKLIGGSLAEEIKAKSLEIYNLAREYARKRDIIVADTKFEFGLDGERLILIDELLTPDSSRFWDARLYKVGEPQDSYDKQPLRDWLVSSGWNKEPPAPPLTPEVVEDTSQRYQEVYRRLTGRKLPPNT